MGISRNRYLSAVNLPNFRSKEPCFADIGSNMHREREKITITYPLRLRVKIWSPKTYFLPALYRLLSLLKL